MDGDSSSWLLLIAIILLILGGGYFAAAETAFASVNPIHIKQRVEDGEKRARKAQYVLDHFNKALSTLLIGNNIMHIGTASLATYLVVDVLQRPDLTTLCTLITTVVVFLVAEMIPKQFAKDCPEATALVFAPSLALLMKILTPVSAFFDGLSVFVSKFFNVAPEPVITEDELIEAIDSLAENEESTPERQELLHSALRFDDAIVFDIMTPLDQVECVEIGMQPEEVLEIARATKYSRLPVYKSTKENLVGLLNIRNYIKAHLASEGSVTVWEQMHSAMSTDDSKLIDELFDEMNQARRHMCFVTNSKKEYIGIVTMEDILEQLVGEIYDEADEVPAEQAEEEATK